MNKVLIADDNTQITKVLKDYASKEGWGCLQSHPGHVSGAGDHDYGPERGCG